MPYIIKHHEEVITEAQSSWAAEPGKYRHDITVCEYYGHDPKVDV